MIDNGYLLVMDPVVRAGEPGPRRIIVVEPPEPAVVPEPEPREVPAAPPQREPEKVPA